VCAIALLLWTAVDLMNVGLCALDNEHALSAAAAVPTMRAVDEAGPRGAGGPAPHVDDCFCCSRCVEPAQMVVPAAEEPAFREEAAVADRLPLPDRAPVYHPPQVLG
jgi:hypothetical protein